MSIIYRYYKQYRHFSHITATRIGGRLDEPEVPLGGVAAGGVVVPKYLWCGPKDAYRVDYHVRMYVAWLTTTRVTGRAPGSASGA